MGRGLSDLQRSILIAAFKAPDNRRGQRMLYYKDICTQYFGWLPGYAIWNNLDGWKWKYDPRYAELLGSHCFATQIMGKKEYQRVMVTISKSVCRLEKRGLVECYQGTLSHWSGVIITEAGKSLLANSKESLTISHYS